MEHTRFVGLDIHKERISIAVSEEYRRAGTGRPGYAPADLPKLYIYGFFGLDRLVIERWARHADHAALRPDLPSAPEYLGKKIQSAEVKMAVLALLVVPATILVPTSLAAVRQPRGLVNDRELGILIFGNKIL